MGNGVQPLEGSGGRIAIYIGLGFSQFTGSIEASGGVANFTVPMPNHIPAGAGTIYIEENTDKSIQIKSLIVRGNQVTKEMATTDITGYKKDHFIYDRIVIECKLSFNFKLRD